MATVNLTLEIPDGMVAEVVNDFTDFHGYSAEDGNRAAFAKQCVIRYIRGCVAQYRARAISIEQAEGLEIN